MEKEVIQLFGAFERSLGRIEERLKERNALLAESLELQREHLVLTYKQAEIANQMIVEDGPK